MISQISKLSMIWPMLLWITCTQNDTSVNAFMQTGLIIQTKMRRQKCVKAHCSVLQRRLIVLSYRKALTRRYVHGHFTMDKVCGVPLPMTVLADWIALEFLPFTGTEASPCTHWTSHDHDSTWNFTSPHRSWCRILACSLNHAAHTSGNVSSSGSFAACTWLRVCADEEIARLIASLLPPPFHPPPRKSWVS